MSQTDKKHETYKFFVGKEKYETNQQQLTGAQIKAKIPNFDNSYSLFLEEPGDAVHAVSSGRPPQVPQAACARVRRGRGGCGQRPE